MPYPGSIDSYTPVQGTTFEASADHASMHNSVGSSVAGLGSALGLTNGTNILANFSAGQQAVPIQGGTLGTIIAKGTFNNLIGTVGTFTNLSLVGGTFTNTITNSGTINNGNYNAATLGTPIAQGAFSNGNITGNGTINWANGDMQYGTLTGNGTLAYTNAGTWQRLTLSFVQNATGGFSLTLPASQYPNGVAPTFGTNANQWNAIVVILNTAGSYLTQSAVAFA